MNLSNLVILGALLMAEHIWGHDFAVDLAHTFAETGNLSWIGN